MNRKPISTSSVSFKTLRFLAGPIFRLSAILLFCIGSLALGYWYGYLPTIDGKSDETLIPERDRDAAIASDKLNAVITSAKERVTHTPSSFGQYRTIFSNAIGD